MTWAISVTIFRNDAPEFFVIHVTKLGHIEPRLRQVKQGTTTLPSGQRGSNLPMPCACPLLFTMVIALQTCATRMNCEYDVSSFIAATWSQINQSGPYEQIALPKRTLTFVDFTENVDQILRWQALHHSILRRRRSDTLLAC
jgi:hypothetical protein